MSITPAELWQKITTYSLALPDQCRQWANDIARTQGAAAALQTDQIVQYLRDQNLLSQYQLDQLTNASEPLLKIGPWRIEDRVQQSPFRQWYLGNDVSRNRKRWLFIVDDTLLQLPEVRQAGPSLEWNKIHSAMKLTDGWNFELPEKQGSQLLLYALPIEGELAKPQSTSPLNIAQWILQLARCMQELHQNRMIHGHVRPDRMWLCPQGKATLLRDPIVPPNAASTTDTWSPLERQLEPASRIHFMAPELSVPDQQWTPAADIYSLGCLWYWLVTGSAPFQASPLNQVAVQHAVSQLYVSENDIGGKRLAECFKFCVAKNPSSRFGQAAALIAALEVALSKTDKAVVSTAAPPIPTSAPKTSKAEPQTVKAVEPPPLPSPPKPELNTQKPSAVPAKVNEGKGELPKPAPSKPEATKPEGVKPEAPKPIQPAVAPPKAPPHVPTTTKVETQSVAATPDTRKVDTPKSETPKTDAVKKETPKSELAKPEPGKTTPSKPELPNAVAAPAEAAKVQSNKSESTTASSQAANTKAETPKVESPKPETPKSEVAKPEVVKAETVKPVVNKSEPAPAAPTVPAVSQAPEKPKTPPAEPPKSEIQKPEPPTAQPALAPPASVSPAANVASQAAPVTSPPISAPPTNKDTTSTKSDSVAAMGNAVAPTTAPPAPSIVPALPNTPKPNAAVTVPTPEAPSTPTANPKPATASPTNEPATATSTPSGEPPKKKSGKKKAAGSGEKKKKKSSKSRPAWVMPAMAVGCLLFMAIVLVVLTQFTGNRPVEKPAPPSIASNAPPSNTTVPNDVGPTAKPVPRDAVHDKFTVISDDKTLPWAPPTSGDPFSLEMLPPEAQVWMYWKPSKFAQDPQGQQLLAVLAADISPGTDYLAARAGTGLENIADAMLALFPGKEGTPELAVRFTLATEISLLDLKAKWGNVQETKSGKATIFTNDRGEAYFISLGPISDDMKVKTFTVGPKKRIEDLVALDGGLPPLRRQLEQLHRRTDANADLTILFAPGFLFTEGRQVLANSVPAIRDSLAQVLATDMQGGMLTTTLKPNWYVELRLVGNADQDASRIASDLNKRFTNLPDEIESRMIAGTFDPSWGKLSLRYPQMLREMLKHLRVNVEDGQAIANFYLPNVAAPNLLVASWLAAHSDSAKTLVANKDEPTNQQIFSPEQFLDRPIKLSFDQESLEIALQSIAEATADGLPASQPKLTMELDYASMEKDGITQNQQIRQFMHNGKPLREVLTDLVKRANPTPGIQDTTSAELKFVWVLVSAPDKPGGKKILLTTRAYVADQKLTLSKEFAAP